MDVSTKDIIKGKPNHNPNPNPNPNHEIKKIKIYNQINKPPYRNKLIELVLIK